MIICCNTIEKIGGGIILTIYKQGDKEEWNACVKSFVNWDIYYLYEYAYSFMLHGDGDIYLIYFENFNDRFCYVVMKNDIADFGCFSSILDKRQYYDWETPYGYGGPLCDHPISVESEQLFKSEIGQYCRKHNIISQFIRFHPLLKNYEVLPEVIETRYLRDTIFIDTSAIDLIMKNMDSKNRNMVRKAQKSNVEIVQEKESSLRICDADSDVIFEGEKTPLTVEEYFRLKELALKSAADFYRLYLSIPDKSRSCLPVRKTFYGDIPRTAEEMYEHTKNVNSYYFGEIGIDVSNDGTIYECRRRGFELLERLEMENYLANAVVCGSYDELWSLRKVMRRFIWHDRIHAKAMYRMAVKTFGEGSVENVFQFIL